MAGLLGGVLPAIYSGADQLKRQIYGLLTNPNEMAQRAGQNLLQTHAENQALMSKAHSNPQNPLQITDPTAFSELTNRYMAGVTGVAPIGMIAYHGSPVRFDKFDITKMGSGEGQQLFGKGMYFAESPSVAEPYMKNVGEYITTVNGQPVDSPVAKSIIRLGGDPEKFIQTMQKKIESQTKALNSASKEEVLPNLSNYDIAKMDLDATLKMVDEAKSYIGKNLRSEPVGNLYKVDIPDEHIPKMLDWDKNIDEQTTEVKNIISNYVKSTNIWKDYYTQLPEKAKSLADDMVSGVKSLDNADNWKKLEKLAPNLDHNVIHDAWTTAFEGTMKSNLTGKELYKTFDYIYGSPERAAEELKNQGIQGIRYLDQFSREKGGTSNFVVFDPTDVKILERNDKPVEGLLD